MPVNTTHADYDFALADWLRARDVLAGEDAVRHMAPLELDVVSGG